MKRPIHAHNYNKIICGASGGLVDLRNAQVITCKRCKKVKQKFNKLKRAEKPDQRQMRFAI